MADSTSNRSAAPSLTVRAPATSAVTDIRRTVRSCTDAPGGVMASSAAEKPAARSTFTAASRASILATPDSPSRHTSA
ncbi:hypothetical protein [Arthrobacter sp. SAFR-014]